MEAVVEEGLCQDSLDAVDEVNFSPDVVTPLVKDVPSLARVVVLIHSFNYKLYSVLKLLLQQFGLLVLIVNVLVNITSLLNEALLLQFRLKDCVVNPHNFSFQLSLSF